MIKDHQPHTSTAETRLNREKAAAALLFSVLLSTLAIHTVQNSAQNTAPNQPAAVQTTPDPNACADHISFEAGHYLRADGMQFRYDQQRVCLYGATIYNSSGPGAPKSEWNKSTYTARLDWDLQMAQAAHLNLLRVTDYALSATANMYDPVIWQNMDYLIAQAQQKGIFILLDLSCYAKHLELQGKNPYTSDQTAGWHDFISFVTNKYQDAPNVAFYSIRGEVNQTNSATFPTTTTQGYLEFFQGNTDEVFQDDHGHHLIEAGGLTHLNQVNSGIPWKEIFALPHVDIASIHVYSADRLNPITNNKDLQVTLPMVVDWATANHKPLDLQEYGVVNQIGDGARADAMKQIIHAAITNHFQSIIFWNLGPETTPGMHFDLNPSYPLAWQEVIDGASQFYSMK